MRQLKISRNGIQIYQSYRQQSRTASGQTSLVLLTAVQLLTVWFLAAAWWENLTSVFPIQTDTFRLYWVLFFFTAALQFLWNLPLRLLGKLSILTVFCVIAGYWIWRHPDAAVNVINFTANAYLSVCRPDANPYPVTTVSDIHMAVMTGLFLTPLLLIWSLSLHIHRGRLFSMLLLLAPASLSLIVSHVPSELSCWLVILSGGLFCSVYRCKNGHAAFVNGAAAAFILAVIVGFSAFASRPLEQYKQPSDGFYAEARVFIQTKWIAPAQNYIKEAQENRNAKKDHADENTKGRAEATNGTDSDEANENETKTADTEAMPPDRASDSQANDPNDLPSETIVDIPDHAAKTPVFSIDDNSGGAESTKGHTDGFPDLDSLSHFQPDQDVRMTISLDIKPEETFYHPVAYGGVYADGRWTEIQSDDAASSEYLQYPDTISRLKELCLTHAPKTPAEASDFIQREFKENTVYDYEPGAVPFGQDFAEYFLFENQKGFCVHFATTAALMYRICGFPSRYVQGYAIPASAFHRQEDGTYLAEVTGEMGHAWCEVSIDSEWVIEEHTLPYRGTRPRSGAPAAASGKRTWRPNAAGWILLLLRFLIRALLCLLIAAILIFVQAALRRQRKYQRFQRLKDGTGIQHIYRAIYDSAVFHGMPKTDLLSREGFEILQKYCPKMDADPMERLYEAVLETMFYKREITREELMHARKLYQQFSCMIKKDLDPYRKFVYQYIKIL